MTWTLYPWPSPGYFRPTAAEPLAGQKQGQRRPWSPSEGQNPILRPLDSTGPQKGHFRTFDRGEATAFQRWQVGHGVLLLRPRARSPLRAVLSVVHPCGGRARVHQDPHHEREETPLPRGVPRAPKTWCIEGGKRKGQPPSAAAMFSAQRPPAPGGVAASIAAIQGGRAAAQWR